jgi:hypothetical protein
MKPHLRDPKNINIKCLGIVVRGKAMVAEFLISTDVSQGVGAEGDVSQCEPYRKSLAKPCKC